MIVSEKRSSEGLGLEMSWFVREENSQGVSESRGGRRQPGEMRKVMLGGLGRRRAEMSWLGG